MENLWIERENRAARGEPYVNGYRKNLSARAHCHEEIETVTVLSGEVDALIDGRSVTMREGEIWVILPGEVHSYTTRTASCTHLMKLYAPSEFLSLRVWERGRITETDPYYGDFRETVEMIVREDAEREAGYSYALASATDRFTMLILRCLSPERVSERAQKEIGTNRDFLARFEVYLEKHYAEQITLDGAAAYMHYSRYYFAHRFAQITGETFFDYVTQFRLERARTALQSGRNVLETALACGFGSARSLHRAFKKHYGIAPVEVKKRK